MGSLYRHISVRWVDADNRRVPAGTLGAEKNRKVDKYWSAKYRDVDGRTRRESLKVRDKGSAKKLLADIELRVERERVGIVDEHLEQASRPLDDHLEEWFASLKQREITARRQTEIPQRMRKLVQLAGWKRLTDIKEDSVRECLNQLGVSLQTRNHYLAHLKQFVRWCIPDRLQSNPIAKIRRSNVATDRRHDRRHLTSEEIKKLVDVTAKSTVIRGKLDGRSRAMLYSLAIGTGFRRGELQSLTPSSFDLENLTVTVAAAYSKHRKKDVQPLPPWLIEPLRKWLAEGRPLWPNLTRHTSKVIRPDLEDAGIPYETKGDDGPLYADFHSLRHTFATLVGQTETSVPNMMRVTRHATPALLMRYVKTTAENKAKCVNQLADPLSNPQTDKSMAD